MKKFFVLVLLAVAIVFMLVACTGEAQSQETTGDSLVETSPETTPIVESDSEDVETTPETIPESETSVETEPIGEPWKPDMGKFNEGKVDYDMVVETIIQAAYPDDRIGQCMNSEEAGVVTILGSDFTDNDASIGGNAAPRTTDSAKALDGKMYMPYSADAPSHLDVFWTTWAPIVTADLAAYKQTAFSVQWDVSQPTTAPDALTMIGCYLTTPEFTIPNEAYDGLWFSFNEKNNTVVVFHPDVTCFTAGWATVAVAEGLLQGNFKATVVCTPDRTTYVYVTPENGTEAVLVAKVAFADGMIRVYEADGSLNNEAESTTDHLKGIGYSLFVYGGGGAIIDEVTLMGASLGKEERNVTITATPTEGNTLGLDITNRQDLVSICYSVWFDAILGSGSEPVTDWHNITEALAGQREWGGVSSFHYWAKPELGYYRSSNKSVIRTHMTQLYAAGVDFLIIDLTNANDGYLGTANWVNYIQTPMDAICDTIMEMRAEGKGTPYVAFWVGDSEGSLYKELYDKYYNVDKWEDCFVYWDNKPLMLTTHTHPRRFPYKDLMTVRSMWGLRGENGYVKGQWSFLNTDNSIHVALNEDGNPEQVSVAVASQETYMSQPTAHGREGGLFWYQQWTHAFEVRPKIVTLTWWNEWTAQRMDVAGLDGPQFVDNYNQNYSRDIEPMQGGHGDQYYQWLIEYIAAYKGGLECPILVEDEYVSDAEEWLIQHQGNS